MNNVQKQYPVKKVLPPCAENIFKRLMDPMCERQSEKSSPFNFKHNGFGIKVRKWSFFSAVVDVFGSDGKTIEQGVKLGSFYKSFKDLSTNNELKIKKLIGSRKGFMAVSDQKIFGSDIIVELFHKENAFEVNQKQERFNEISSLLQAVIDGSADLSIALSIAAKALLDEDPCIRTNAVGILLLAAEKGADISFVVTTLENLLNDPHRHVKGNATSVLAGYYFDKGEVAKFEELLRHPDKIVRKVAKRNRDLFKNA